METDDQSRFEICNGCPRCAELGTVGLRGHVFTKAGRKIVASISKGGNLIHAWAVYRKKEVTKEGLDKIIREIEATDMHPGTETEIIYAAFLATGQEDTEPNFVRYLLEVKRSESAPPPYDPYHRQEGDPLNISMNGRNYGVPGSAYLEDK